MICCPTCHWKRRIVSCPTWPDWKMSPTAVAEFKRLRTACLAALHNAIGTLLLDALERERDRRFAVPRCWSRRDSNRRSHPTKCSVLSSIWAAFSIAAFSRSPSQSKSAKETDVSNSLWTGGSQCLVGGAKGIRTAGLIRLKVQLFLLRDSSKSARFRHGRADRWRRRKDGRAVASRRASTIFADTQRPHRRTSGSH